MQFLNKKSFSTPHAEMHSECTGNSLQEAILTRVAMTMIHTSEFARDADDEIYVVMSGEVFILKGI